MERWLFLTAFFCTASCLTCSIGDSEDGCSAQSEVGIGAPGAAMLQSFKLLGIQTEEDADEGANIDTDLDLEVDAEQDTSKSKSAMRTAMITALNGKATALRYHKMLLDRSLVAMNQAMITNDPTGSLENLVGDFLNNQASAQDSCPAQLLEAQRQLTALHSQVRDLAAEVNATETEETVDIVELRNVQVEMGQIEDSTPGKHDKCRKQHEEDLKTYFLLKKELQEMWTIANPTVKMDVRTAYKRFLKEQENRSKKVTKIVTYKRGPTEVFNVTEDETEKYAKWTKAYWNESANKSTNTYGNISTNKEFNASKTYKNTYDVIHHSNFTKSSHTTTGDGKWSNWSSLAMEYAAPNISYHTTVITSTLAPIELNLSAGDVAFDMSPFKNDGWTVTDTSRVRVEVLMKNLLFQLLISQMDLKSSVESAVREAVLAVQNDIGHPELTDADIAVKLVQAYQAEDTVAQILIPPAKGNSHNDIAVEVSQHLFDIASKIEEKVLDTPGITTVSTATILTDAHVVTEADYVADQSGDITCGGGSIPIVDKGECQIASGSLGFEWGGEISEADEPSTCIKRTSELERHQSFFNLAVSGAAKAGTTPICKEAHQASYGAEQRVNIVYYQICGSATDSVTCSFRSAGGSTWSAFHMAARFTGSHWECAPWSVGNPGYEIQVSLNNNPIVTSENEALSRGIVSCTASPTPSTTQAVCPPDDYTSCPILGCTSWAPHCQTTCTYNGCTTTPTTTTNTTTTTTTSAAYVETALGSTVCPTGYTVIMDAEVCKQAIAALGRPWGRVDSWSNIQPGCFRENNGAFNTDSGGRSHELIANICEVAACVTTSEEACRVAAQVHGFALGTPTYPFTSSSSDYFNGCYYSSALKAVFYGDIGTPAERAAPITGYDHLQRLVGICEVFSWSGPCNNTGNCITSPNYPSRYESLQFCEIMLPDAGYQLNVISFETEQGFDMLYVNGMPYYGSQGPQDIVPSSSLTWTSDGSASTKGWEICALLTTPTMTTNTTTTTTTSVPACDAAAFQNEWGSSCDTWLKCRYDDYDEEKDAQQLCSQCGVCQVPCSTASDCDSGLTCGGDGYCKACSAFTSSSSCPSVGCTWTGSACATACVTDSNCPSASVCLNGICQAMFQVGDIVRVRESISKPFTGWGMVHHGDCGVVREMSPMRVDFPSHKHWSAKPDEMERCETTPTTTTNTTTTTTTSTTQTTTTNTTTTTTTSACSSGHLFRNGRRRITYEECPSGYVQESGVADDSRGCCEACSSGSSWTGRRRYGFADQKCASGTSYANWSGEPGCCVAPTPAPTDPTPAPTARFTVGDCVKILSRPNHCSCATLGTSYVITTDDKSSQPYKIGTCNCWFYSKNMEASTACETTPTTTTNTTTTTTTSASPTPSTTQVPKCDAAAFHNKWGSFCDTWDNCFHDDYDEDKDAQQLCSQCTVCQVPCSTAFDCDSGWTCGGDGYCKASHIWAVHFSGQYCGSNSGRVALGVHTLEKCKSAASANAQCGKYLESNGNNRCSCYDTCSAPSSSSQGTSVYIRQATCSSYTTACPDGKSNPGDAKVCGSTCDEATCCETTTSTTLAILTTTAPTSTSTEEACVWFLSNSGHYCAEGAWHEVESLLRCQDSASSQGMKYVSYINDINICKSSADCTPVSDGPQDIYHCEQASPTPSPTQAATFALTAAGASTCAYGYFRITSEVECQLAATSMGLSYVSVGSWIGMQSGCDKYHTDNSVYFNRATADTAHSDYAMICTSEVQSGSRSLLQEDEEEKQAENDEEAQAEKVARKSHSRLQMSSQSQEKPQKTQALANASSLLQEEEVEEALSETPPKPALTSVSSSLGLASKAKSLAGVLAECMASHGMGGRGSLLQEDSDEMQGPGMDVCPASDVKVELDGSQGILVTNTELKVGEAQGAACQTVNAKFSGEIVLLCKAGFIQPDMTGCQPLDASAIVGSGDEWTGKKCTTKQGIKATIQGATVTFYPNADISSGGQEYKQCNEINENFTGEIILNCKDGLIRPDVSGCVPPKTPESEACEQQKLQLEITYSRAYVELTRLVSEYEEIINSTACDDAVEADETDRMKPLKVKVETLTKEIRYITEHTRSYRIQLHDMKKAEAKLTQHVAVLRKKCEDLDETISSLDKVRDAIHVISLCPGLEPAEFSVPTFLGILHANFDNTQFTDEQIDVEMNALCAHEQKKDGPKPRAAETSEIHLKAILNAPVTNPETMPLWGTCPQCAGEDDDPDPDAPKHASGHARICWNEGKPLILAEARKTCSKGRKAVMCVEDKADPSKGQYTPPPGGWNWNEGEWTESWK